MAARLRGAGGEVNRASLVQAKPSIATGHSPSTFGVGAERS
jgi:hypothetical protein